MDEISQEEFDAAAKIKPEKKDLGNKGMSERDFKKMLEEMQNPVLVQQNLAVTVKTFLDKRIAKEMLDKGVLSDGTRRWVESFNSILEKIQKALKGDKNISLNSNKISHSQIATKMREAMKNESNANR